MRTCHYNELIWCINNPNAHTHNFQKGWSFLRCSFAPVSILKGVYISLKVYLCIRLLWGTNNSLIFLPEKKMKKTLNDNQIYFFFEKKSWWTSILDHFKLQMQACIIFLTAIVKIRRNSIVFSLLSKIENHNGIKSNT